MFSTAKFKKIIASLLFVLLFQSSNLLFAMDCVPSAYSVTNFTTSYDSGTDRTNFSWTVCWNGTPPSLSHFGIGVGACISQGQVFSSSPVSVTVGPDGSHPSNVRIIKWDNPGVPNTAGGCADFTVVLSGHYAAVNSTAYLKAGTSFCEYATQGPDCSSSPSPTPSSSASSTPSISSSPSTTPTASASASVTPSSSASSTPSISSSPSTTPTASASVSVSPSSSASITPSASASEIPSASISSSPSESPSASISETPSASASSSPSESFTPSVSASASASATPSETPSAVVSSSPSESPSASASSSPSESASPSVSASVSASPTPSETPSAFPSDSPSSTPTASPSSTPPQFASCDAGGPYNIPCNGTQVVLDGSKSAVNDYYFWSTDCVDGTFNEDTVVNPILSFPAFNPSAGPCKITLDVAIDDGDSFSCSSELTFSICPTCEDISVAEAQFAVDGNSKSQAGLVKKLTKELNRASNKSKSVKNFIKSALQQANDLYTQSWTTAWSIPSQLVSCTGPSNCITVSNTDYVNALQNNSLSLYKLAESVVKYGKKVTGKKRFGKSILKNASELHQRNLALAKTVPASISNCPG